jgi:hypothetical protein
MLTLGAKARGLLCKILFRSATTLAWLLGTFTQSWQAHPSQKVPAEKQTQYSFKQRAFRQLHRFWTKVGASGCGSAPFWRFFLRSGAPAPGKVASTVSASTAMISVSLGMLPGR